VASDDSIRRLAIADLDSAGERLGRLIASGETLFVERKEKIPEEGLGPTVASFANMLGGWVLLGVRNDGKAVGYEPPGRSEIQDHVRELLRRDVDPMPPFSAASAEYDGKPIGVVRVHESVDTPHLVSATGAIYVREPGGKVPISDHRTLLEMAPRGRDARAKTETRLYNLTLINEALEGPPQLPADDPQAESLPLILQIIVLAGPLTVTGEFADRALAESTADWLPNQAAHMFPGGDPVTQKTYTFTDARARGIVITASQNATLSVATLALDAAGVMAARVAQRRTQGVLDLPAFGDEYLTVMLQRVTESLDRLEAHGRAAVHLVMRGTTGLTVQTSTGAIGNIEPGQLHVGGEAAIPAATEDLDDLVGRWIRELAREAGIPAWEPDPHK
jgi:hypothetical protein